MEPFSLLLLIFLLVNSFILGPTNSALSIFLKPAAKIKRQSELLREPFSYRTFEG